MIEEIVAQGMAERKYEVRFFQRSDLAYLDSTGSPQVEKSIEQPPSLKLRRPGKTAKTTKSEDKPENVAVFECRGAWLRTMRNLG